MPNPVRLKIAIKVIKESGGFYWGRIEMQIIEQENIPYSESISHLHKIEYNGIKFILRRCGQPELRFSESEKKITLFLRGRYREYNEEKVFTLVSSEKEAIELKKGIIILLRRYFNKVKKERLYAGANEA